MIAAHQPRLLHTMIRARDLPRMLEFYCGLLGMREIRRIEMPELRRTLVFAGYGSTPAEAQVEFWHDWDEAGAAAVPSPGRAPVTAPVPEPTCRTSRGTHPFHLGIGVRDIHGCVRELASRGVKITREPGPIRTGGRVIALLEDPEGHEVELLAAD
jgi:lactoylglutathione lyase